MEPCYKYEYMGPNVIFQSTWRLYIHINYYETCDRIPFREFVNISKTGELHNESAGHGESVKEWEIPKTGLSLCQFYNKHVVKRSLHNMVEYIIIQQ